MAPNRPHQLYWHTIIPLKLKLYDEKGAHLQMGNQLDLDIGSHGKLLDSYTRAALFAKPISLFLSTQPSERPLRSHRATYWFRILEKGLVYCIHSCKVGHINQEDANPDHVFHA